ncbi:class 2 [Cordyceps militaris]|uniref:Class 2 n=1 Tax=Cordyceps militaris TaxID=73501 RepID=A0A2H4SWA9_CORMI|nr:class 2 [Cordyceps militaris]
MHLKAAIALAAGLASVVSAGPTTPADLQMRQARHNDFSCKPSANHPNPVVLLHGLGATYYEDINLIEAFLQARGFCTFSLTYGAYDGFPFVGGLKPIDESSHEISDLILDVHAKTGASKIDIVGHSEGGFQALYVPKFREGVAAVVEHIVAIAPPTHGTSFANLWKLAPLFGQDARKDIGAILEKVGCAPCDEISVNGPSIAKLNAGPIVQPGNKVTIIISKYDELVTPPTTAFVHEDGVNNIYVQDYCPYDFVGHIGEAYDWNVWNLILNSLENQVGRKFVCLAGSPGK